MKTKLEEIAEQQRPIITIKNVYRFDGTNQYSARHPNALAPIHGSDDPSNIKGKGIEGPIGADGAGGAYDIYGNGVDMASGRIGNLVKNQFNKENPYPYMGIEVGSNISF